MPSIVNLAAQKINADVAGLTSAEPATPTAQAASFSEVTDNLIGTEYGGLDSLFNEGLPSFVDTSVEKPTDSLRGRLGGLVPSRGSVVAPGPTVQPDSAKTVTAPTVLTTTLPGTVARLRKALKI